MLKEKQHKHCKDQFEKDSKKEHKNARAPHSKDGFFSKSSESRPNKRRELVEASLDASGINDESNRSLKINVK